MNRKEKLLYQGGRGIIVFMLAMFLMSGCAKPDEEIVLRDIKDVIIDTSTEPILRANAIFYNPNDMRARLKKINVEIFINGKKAASVDQSFKTMIPARGEFTVPLEVKLAMKELRVVDTIFGMLGLTTFKIHYLGSLRLSYHGVPINVPVDHEEDVRTRF
jgi:Late embryogenesis abundant protein.